METIWPRQLRTPEPTADPAAAHTPASLETVRSGLLRMPAPTADPAPMRHTSLTAAAAQAKLDVGAPHDRFELEADRIAEHVVRAPDDALAPPPTISPLRLQRQETDLDERVRADLDEDLLQTSRLQRVTDEDDERLQSPPLPGTLQRAAEKVKASVEPDEEQPKRCRDRPLPGLQAKGADGVGPAPASVEAAVARARGGGTPLPDATRRFMESRLGRDLGDVRVHTGGTAAEAARAVHARAFTVGSDIFLPAGRYRPDSSDGRRLLAHELVHTIQQGGGSARVQPARLQREGDAEAASQIEGTKTPADDLKVFEDTSAGTIDARPAKRKRGTMWLPALAIPFFAGGPKGASGQGALSGRPAPGKNKIVSGQPYQYLGPSDRSGRQREIWKAKARSGFAQAVKTALPTKVEAWPTQGVIGTKEGGVEIFYLRRKTRDAPPIMIGALEDLAHHDLAVVPAWTEKGEKASFDVDHIHELQLGGLDDWDNLWLLESSTNRSSGSIIANDLEQRIRALITAADRRKFWVEERGGPRPAVDDVRYGWRLMIESFRQKDVTKGDPDLRLSRDDLATGAHLVGLRALDDTELATFGLRPGDKPAFLLIFPSPTGGFPRRLRLDRSGKPQLPEKATDRFGFYRGLFLAQDGLQYRPPGPDDPEGAQVGSISGLAFKKRNKKGEIFEPAPVVLPLRKAEALALNVHVDQGPLYQAVRQLTVKGMSLLEIAEAGLTPEGDLFANGRITATKALFPGLEIPVGLLGDEVFVDAGIPADRLDLGPLHVTESSLRIGAGDNGLFLAGGAQIAIDGLGHGAISAQASSGSVKVGGGFEFDLAFLEGTRIDFTYDFRTDAFTIKLDKGIKKGALPGVASGRVTIAISRGPAGGGAEEAGDGAVGVSVDGALLLSGPLAGTKVTVTYDPTAGVVIGADDIALPVQKIPGVEDARVSVRARRDPETGEWRLSGGGAATMSVAGVTGGLRITIDGEAVVISGMGQFTKGPASGFVAITATNQAVDAEGNPIPGEAADTFRLWGRGGATIQFGKLVRGAAQLEVTPDEGVIIVGTVGLPPTFKVFDRWKEEKELFALNPPRFRIWGVSVAGIGVGIFAFVDATITFDAFVGPGVIRNAEVCVHFELDRPEETVIEGGAEFYVPAGAGLTLDLGGGLEAQVLNAKARGRVGLDGRLGIAAEGKAGLGLRWTPTAGLELGAEIEGKARPQFELNANARVTVSVHLLVRKPSKTWGPWKKPLGKFGPEMEFGITAPVAWTEARGLDFSLDRIAVDKPRIDAAAMMKSAFLRLV